MVEVALRHRQLVEALAVDVVGDADGDALEPGQHVELRHDEVGDAVDARRVAGDGGVVPAAAAGAARGGAELEAGLAQELARLVKELGRERAGTDARRVRLDDADDAVDAVRADAGARRGAAGGRVRGGDERIRAVVNIQHGGLTTLEQHRLAALERLVQHERRVGDHGAQALGVRQQVVDDLVDRDRATVEHLHEQVVLLVEGRLDLLTQDVLVEQILNTDAHPVDLVGVRRADAAPRRADLALAEEALGHLVEGAVVVRDDVRVGADQQLRHVDAAGAQRLELAEEHLDVDDDAVCDDRSDAVGQDSARQQVQRVLLVADDDGVAGVVAAVELDDVVDAPGEQVGGLALSFIAPLGADDDSGRHGWSLSIDGDDS